MRELRQTTLLVIGFRQPRSAQLSPAFREHVAASVIPIRVFMRNTRFWNKLSVQLGSQVRTAQNRGCVLRLTFQLRAIFEKKDYCSPHMNKAWLYAQTFKSVLFRI